MSKSKSAQGRRQAYFTFWKGINANEATRLYNFQFWHTLDKAQQSGKAKAGGDATE